MRRKLSKSEIRKRLRAGAYHDGAKPLSSKRVARLKGEGRYHDGLVRGLYLQVSPTGARSWLLRYEVLGKERMMGLGSAQEFSLAQARERALEARRLLADGKDPLRAKREAKAASKEAAGRRRTFREAAQEYYQQHLPSWRSIAHAKQWMRSLEVYAFPIIGSMDVADIITADVLRVVQPHWQTRTVTADRIRNRVESVIALAAVSGYRPKGPNPAAWQDHLNNVLPAVKKVAKVQHHPALAHAELPAFMQELRRKEGTAARALEFTILTAARAGETLGARWDEIDLATKTWTIPPERMKREREHVVPLAAPVVELLQSLPREDGNPFVFIGVKKGAGLSAMAFFRLLTRMNRPDITTHGMRATFSTWASEETNHASATIEVSLAHSVGNKTEQAYKRGTPLFKKRIALMDAWSRFCSKPVVAKGDNVVSIGRAR